MQSREQGPVRQVQCRAGNRHVDLRGRKLVELVIPGIGDIEIACQVHCKTAGKRSGVIDDHLVSRAVRLYVRDRMCTARPICSAYVKAALITKRESVVLQANPGDGGKCRREVRWVEEVDLAGPEGPPPDRPVRGIENID